MPNLFGVNIAGLLKSAMGSGLLPVTLTEPSVGTRTAGQLSAGTNPTTATHTARGFIDRTKKDFDFGTEIAGSKRTITILGATLSTTNEPVPGWRVTIEGKTYEVVRVDRDPAAATFDLRCIGVV